MSAFGQNFFYNRERLQQCTGKKKQYCGAFKVLHASYVIKERGNEKLIVKKKEDDEKKTWERAKRDWDRGIKTLFCVSEGVMQRERDIEKGLLGQWKRFTEIEIEGVKQPQERERERKGLLMLITSLARWAKWKTKNEKGVNTTYDFY